MRRRVGAIPLVAFAAVLTVGGAPAASHGRGVSRGANRMVRDHRIDARPAPSSE